MLTDKLREEIADRTMATVGETVEFICSNIPLPETKYELLIYTEAIIATLVKEHQLILANHEWR